MYNKYFGLTDKPFSIAPDPRYLFMSDQHREALAHLVYGIGEGGGFVLLTGEVGTGKTTVCRCLLEQIPDTTRIAFILNPKLSTTELLATICDEMRISYAENPSLKQLNDALNEFLLASHAEGLKIVLMIDEAQNLSSDTLEQIRLLTNLETNKEKLLQIVLIGQPELKDLLAKHELRQLAQRITARFHLIPLTEEECESYILHRLAVSGFSDSLFDKKAIQELFRRTGGIPRLINVLCDRSMLGAYARNRKQIGISVVKQAAFEVMGGDDNDVLLSSEQRIVSSNNSWRLASAVLTVLLIVSASFIAYLYPQQEKIDQDDLVEQQVKIDQQAVKLEQATKDNQQLRHSLEILQAAKDTRISNTAEVVTAKPKAKLQKLLPFLPVEVQPTSLLNAQQQLLQRWNIEYSLGSDAGVCDFAILNQLRCDNDSSDWWFLRIIDRPVILRMTALNGQSVYGVLLALDEESALINFSGSEFLLKRTEVSDYWDGEYFFFWQSPPNYQQPLSLSMTGIPVQWLLKKLARVDDLDLIVPPNAVYNAALKARVKKFQLQHSLRSDGIAGPHTLIVLNSQTNKKSPRLSISDRGS